MWMYDRMTAEAAESSTWNKGTSWKHEGQWRRMAKVGRKLVDSGQSRRLDSRQRKIPRNLKKMIDREKNGMARLLQELKKGIRARG